MCIIDITEIKNMLGRNKNLDDKVWKDIIGEVDINGDGEVSLKEFKKMMKQLVSVKDS